MLKSDPCVQLVQDDDPSRLDYRPREPQTSGTGARTRIVTAPDLSPETAPRTERKTSWHIAKVRSSIYAVTKWKTGLVSPHSWWGLIRQRLMAVFASYRPELHYMRGRGPKWREEHSDSE
jgi:hypothetical protein